MINSRVWYDEYVHLPPSVGPISACIHARIIYIGCQATLLELSSKRHRRWLAGYNGPSRMELHNSQRERGCMLQRRKACVKTKVGGMTTMGQGVERG